MLAHKEIFFQLFFWLVKPIFNDSFDSKFYADHEYEPYFGVLDCYLQKNIDFRLKKGVYRGNLKKFIFHSSFKEI